jgi:hypothetical protein
MASIPVTVLAAGLLLCNSCFGQDRAVEPWRTVPRELTRDEVRQFQEWGEKRESDRMFALEAERMRQEDDANYGSPELRNIKGRILAAEARVLTYLKVGRGLAVIFGVLLLIILALFIKRRITEIRTSCSFKRSDYEVKPILYGVGANVLYVVFAATLCAYVLIPVFSSAWLRILLQPVLFGVGISGNVISGIVVARVAKQNRFGNALLFSVLLIVTNGFLSVFSSQPSDPVLAFMGVLSTVPLTLVGAIITTHYCSDMSTAVTESLV